MELEIHNLKLIYPASPKISIICFHIFKVWYRLDIFVPIIYLITQTLPFYQPKPVVFFYYQFEVVNKYMIIPIIINSVIEAQH